MAYEAREFMVYFPWDEYVLTQEAQAVIQQAAQYSSEGKATRVTLVGYTDSSGSAAYNTGLSEQRAKAVSDALVSLGLAAANLAVDWKGETNLAVPTPDGTKEPLNRRTTVMINF
jgi:outer membrane protein OmpA-like peptidoglycan-associated protein